MKRISLLAVSLVMAASIASGQVPSEKSPEDVFRNYPNRLADFPPGWVTTKPLRLEVCFNLKYPVNSPEASAFITQLYLTITSLPYGVQVRLERPITPAQFGYCASMFFRDWRHYRQYETSDGFLKFYRETWKPAVTSATENLSVLDDESASAP
jgi:hypothetical protein